MSLLRRLQRKDTMAARRWAPQKSLQMIARCYRCSREFVPDEPHVCIGVPNDLLARLLDADRELSRSTSTA